MLRMLAAVPALPVSDERRAVAFYADALGFEELTENGEELGILCCDAVELHLWVPDGSAAGAETYLAGSGSCRIEVTGIDELYQRCLGLSVVHPNAPLAHQPWGMTEFGVLDPDNNLFTLYERRPSERPVPRDSPGPEPAERQAPDSSAARGQPLRASRTRVGH